MKNYVKIKSDGRSLQTMPQTYNAHWDLRNDEATQDFCANHDHWLIKRDTEPPTFDPETQYLTFSYEEQDGYAVQVWEIHDREIRLEPTNDNDGVNE